MSASLPPVIKSASSTTESSATIVERSLSSIWGHRRVLTKDYESAQGLAWLANGKEIWFTASDAAELNSLRAVDLRGGQTRIVAAAPARLHLQDIAEDGQVLITSDAVNYRVGVGDSKSGRLLYLSAFEYTVLSNISNDGSMILVVVLISPATQTTVFTCSAPTVRLRFWSGTAQEAISHPTASG